jgi:hypothetical protein
VSSSDSHHFAGLTITGVSDFEAKDISNKGHVIFSYPEEQNDCCLYLGISDIGRSVKARIFQLKKINRLPIFPRTVFCRYQIKSAKFGQTSAHQPGGPSGTDVHCHHQFGNIPVGRPEPGN